MTARCQVCSAGVFGEMPGMARHNVERPSAQAADPVGDGQHLAVRVRHRLGQLPQRVRHALRRRRRQRLQPHDPAQLRVRMVCCSTNKCPSGSVSAPRRCICGAKGCPLLRCWAADGLLPLLAAGLTARTLAYRSEEGCWHWALRGVCACVTSTPAQSRPRAVFGLYVAL